MRQASLCAVAILASGSCPAFAQPVFFDDFDGPALAPQWGAPEPDLWSYNFNGGRLNVTGLHYPSHPSAGGNYMNIGALFQGQQDFRADAWMSWGSFQRPQRLRLELFADAGPSGGATIFSFGFSNELNHGPAPVVVASAGGGSITRIAAPIAGTLHQFTVIRSGLTTSFLLNDSLIAEFAQPTAIRIGGLGFDFVGPYPGDFSGFSIDRVIVVPSTGTLATTVIAMMVIARRRRRRSL